MTHRIVRLPEVQRLSGISRSTIYARVAQGLFPKPIALGPRIIGWTEVEVDAMNAARVRGSHSEEIRSLVSHLEAARESAA